MTNIVYGCYASIYGHLAAEHQSGGDDNPLDFEREEASHDWVHAELAKFERGEPAMVRRDGNVVRLLIPQWKPKPNGSAQPDHSEAARFLTSLDPTATYFTFQTFDDDKERVAERKRKRIKDPFAHIIHGSLDEVWEKLCELNAQGAGIYVTVNETDGKGRSNKNIKRVRALFNDLDGAPLEPVLKSKQPPHLVVESSPGKFHAYRFVTGINLGQFEGLQKGLAAEFRSDSSVHDLPRVLRLPGFLHQKDKPFLSRIVSTLDAPLYCGDDFVATTQSKSPSGYKQFANQRYGNSEWRQLNSLALAHMAMWVPEIFPKAYPYHEGGYRVAPTDRGPGEVHSLCGRPWSEHQEDLSFDPIEGIKDFTVQGEGEEDEHGNRDPKDGSRTPIDIVMEHIFGASPEDLAQREPTAEFEQAVEWLRKRLPEEANPEPQTDNPASSGEDASEDTGRTGPLICLLAEKLWGKPSQEWKNQVYFNANKVVVDYVKMNWFDFENNKGGGLKDLMKRVEIITRKQTKDAPSVIVCAADVEMLSQDYLWPGHLQRGAQELLSGVSDLGKSQVQMHYIACATARLQWPDGAPAIEPMNVLLLTAEDNIQQIVVPRLHAAGADPSRVHILKYIKKDDEDERMFFLAEDLDQLERDVARIGNVGLICIDPITAYMGGKMDSHKATEVRSQLGPLKDFAERTNIALSTITHPAKAAGQRALDHFIGSQAYIAASRIGHLCIEEVEIDDGERIPTGRVLFTNPRNSGGPKMPTLAYRSQEHMIQKGFKFIKTVRVVGEKDVVDITADEAVAAVSGKKQDSQPKVQAFLREKLKDHEPVAQNVIVEEATQLNFTAKQLRTAREKLGIQTYKGGLDSGWLWVWPRKHISKVTPIDPDKPKSE